MENFFFFIFKIIIILLIIICSVLTLLTHGVIKYEPQGKNTKKKKYTKALLIGLVALSSLTTLYYFKNNYENIFDQSIKIETNKYETTFDQSNKIETNKYETTFDQSNKIETNKYESTFDQSIKNERQTGSKDLLINGGDSYTKPLYESNVIDKININDDTTDRSPIMILPNENERLIPNRDGDIVLPIGTKVCMYCTSSMFKEPFGNSRKIEAEFLGNTTFSINGEIYKLSDLECEKIPMPTTKNKDGFIEFTYELEEGKSISVMIVAFDPNNYITLYVKYKIYPAAMNCKKKVNGKQFTADPEYFDKNNIKNCLKFNKIAKEFSEKFNFTSEETKIFINILQRLTRGHLAGKNDFIFSGDQKSTYNHLNVCFQWMTINNCNCSAIEEGIRAFSNKTNDILTCYSGSMGVCTPLNKDGVPTEYYTKCSNEVKIPVPKFIFRILISDKTGEGIVFITINDPFLRVGFDKAEYIIGKDVGDQINWIKWDRKDIRKGYSYAISVPDFIAVKDFPLEDLHTTGLLGVQSI